MLQVPNRGLHHYFSINPNLAVFNSIYKLWLDYVSKEITFLYIVLRMYWLGQIRIEKQRILVFFWIADFRILLFLVYVCHIFNSKISYVYKNECSEWCVKWRRTHKKNNNPNPQSILNCGLLIRILGHKLAD